MRYALALALAAALGPGACRDRGTRGTGPAPTGGKVFTEADFSTDTERRAFLQKHVPVQIPYQAGDIRFEYDGRLEETLVASFVLPQDVFESYRQSVIGPEAMGRRVLDFAATRGQMRGTIEFIPDERKVKLDCRAGDD